MISIIVAYDDNYLIGKGNDLPWHHPEDLRNFRRLTLHHTCVMGRKTFESIVHRIKGVLPDRKNLVVTSQQIDHPEIEIVRNVNAFLEMHEQSKEEIFIIGGRRLYEEALPYAKRLYITRVKGTHEGDTYFPKINLDDYVLTYTEKLAALTFTIYERVS